MSKQHTKFEKPTVNWPLYIVAGVIVTVTIGFLFIGWIGLALYFFQNYHIAWNVFWGWECLGGLASTFGGVLIGGLAASTQEDKLREEIERGRQHDN